MVRFALLSSLLSFTLEMNSERELSFECRHFLFLFPSFQRYHWPLSEAALHPPSSPRARSCSFLISPGTKGVKRIEFREVERVRKTRVFFRLIKKAVAVSPHCSHRKKTRSLRFLLLVLFAFAPHGSIEQIESVAQG